MADNGGSPKSGKDGVGGGHGPSQPAWLGLSSGPNDGLDLGNGPGKGRKRGREDGDDQGHMDSPGGTRPWSGANNVSPANLGE